jgi:hypothetical protein
MVESELGLGRRKRVKIFTFSFSEFSQKIRRRSRIPPAVTKMMGEANMHYADKEFNKVRYL